MTEAESLYREAMEYFHETGNRLWQANHLAAIGDIAVEQGRWSEALKLYQEAHDLRLKIGAVLNAVDSALDIAELQWASGQIQAARDATSEAERLLGTRKAPQEQIRISLMRAWLGLSSVEREAARAAAEQAEALAHEIEAPRYGHFHPLAICAFQAGADAKALQILREGLAAVDRLLALSARNYGAAYARATLLTARAVVQHRPEMPPDAVDALAEARRLVDLPGRQRIERARLAEMGDAFLKLSQSYDDALARSLA